MQIPPLGPIAPVQSPFTGSLTSPAGGTQGSSFTSLISKSLQSVSASENNADTLVQNLASGQSVNPADVMIATSQAQLSIQMLAAVRDQAINAYKDIMSLQV